MLESRFALIARVAALPLVLAIVGLGFAPWPDETKPERVALAIVTNPRNPTTDLALGELRAHFYLKRSRWPNGERCEVFLRPNDTLEMRVLLDVVYQKSEKELAKYWVREVFRGSIKEKPSVVAATSDVGTRVAANIGAVSIVPANAVPEGVRILTIDGLSPTDEAYPLFVMVEPTEEPAPAGSAR